MVKKVLERALEVLSLCCLGLLLTACSASKCDLGVFIDQNIQDAYGYCPTLEVDVVGLSDVEQKRMEKYDVDKYFAANSQFRKSLNAVTLKFSENDMRSKILDSGAEVWDGWKKKGTNYVAVLANLPLIDSKEEDDEKKDPNVDPRKLIINLHNGKWYSSDPSEHFVVISSSGVIEVKDKPKGGEKPLTIE